MKAPKDITVQVHIVDKLTTEQLMDVIAEWLKGLPVPNINRITMADVRQLAEKLKAT